ncbi:TPA: LexA family protein [Serratia fonticola]
MKDDLKTQLQRTRRERLSTLIDKLGTGGQKRLAEALGIAPDYVSRMLYPIDKKGKKGISGDMARRIEQFFSVQIGWLDGLDIINSNLVTKPSSDYIASAVKILPLLEWALPLSHEQISETSKIRYPAMVACGPQAYWLKVRDDTMSGSVGINYPKGALILVEPTTHGKTQLISGDKVIAKKLDTDDLTFKIYVEDAGHRWLKGVMPGYPTLNCDDYQILGIVLGAWIA